MKFKPIFYCKLFVISSCVSLVVYAEDTYLGLEFGKYVAKNSVNSQISNGGNSVGILFGHSLTDNLGINYSLNLLPTEYMEPLYSFSADLVVDAYVVPDSYSIFAFAGVNQVSNSSQFERFYPSLGIGLSIAVNKIFDLDFGYQYSAIGELHGSTEYLSAFAQLKYKLGSRQSGGQKIELEETRATTQLSKHDLIEKFGFDSILTSPDEKRVDKGLVKQSISIKFPSNSSYPNLAEWDKITDFGYRYDFEKLAEVNISGHTDSTGDSQYNLLLSAKRANRVSSKLQQLGIDGDILKIKSFGEAHPLKSNSSGGGMAANRRVDIEFIFTF